ncbi:lantibiotic dehydratase [Streptomyces sp. NPDC001568]|uniref:lantibiotic dehydratase n=1 Tax=Streptomyces sp. NPDC001568 TaxID=3364588 RepID=UPI0036AF750E
MRGSQSWDLVQRILDRSASITVERGEISDLLHTVIGGVDHEDTMLRPRLVSLRRDLFKERVPKQAWAGPVIASLPPELREKVVRFTDALTIRRHLTSQLDDILPAEQRALEQGLRSSLRDDNYRHALSLASPTLAEELEKWLADSGVKMRPQTIARLGEYLTRAATRTSPYSTFTISGFGAWVPEGAALRFLDGGKVRSVVDLSPMALRNVKQFLTKNSRLLPAHLVRVNPSATPDSGAISFVHGSGEPIHSLPSTATVAECLRIVRESNRCSLGTLWEKLEIASGRPPETVRPFVSRLLESGLLELHPPVPDQSPDPFGELASWIEVEDPAGSADLVTGLRSVRDALRIVLDPTVTGGSRRHRAHLRAALDALGQELRPWWQADAIQDKGLFHENAVYPAPVAELSTEAWRPALDDLDAVRQWLGLFDPALPLRIVLSELCHRRFGPGTAVPVLDLHRAVQEELAEPAHLPDVDLQAFLRPRWPSLRATLAACGLPRIRELGRLVDEATTMVTGPAGTGTAVRIDPDSLREFVAGLPPWVQEPSSMTCYVQLLADGAEPRLVMNVASPGHGRATARLAAIADQAGVPTVLAERPEVPPGEAVPAEFDAAFGSGLNVRRPSVPYEIAYPSAVSGRPRDRQIDMGDLVAIADPVDGLLRLHARRLGKQVHPLHLGLIGEPFVPPLARLLISGFAAHAVLEPGVSFLSLPHTGTDPETSAPDAGGVTFQPRVEVGRVTIRRARWLVAPDRVPVRVKGDTPGGRLLRLADWTRRAGLPDRSFVRALPAPSEEESDVARWVLQGGHKPVYVDLASPLHVRTLTRLVEGCRGMMVFEEPLPAPESAPRGDDGSARVTEFVVELTRRHGQETKGG